MRKITIEKCNFTNNVMIGVKLLLLFFTLLVSSFEAIAQCGSGYQNGGYFMNVANKIYAVNIRTAKSTLVTTSTFVSGDLNSFATNASNKLMYYCAGAPSNSTNKTLYAYDGVTNTHLVVDADVSTKGIILGTSGLGSGGASFYGGFLYLAIEAVNTGTANPDTVIYKCTMSADGKSLLSAVPVIQVDASDSMGDFAIVSDQMYNSYNGALTRYTLPATYVSGINAIPTANVLGLPLYVSQVAQDYNDNIWTIGSKGYRQFFPATNTFSGATILTTLGTTVAGVFTAASPADAGGCVYTDAMIGDLVFADTNNNGVFDGSDVGLNGVTIDIYDDINGDGIISASDDLLLTTVTTSGGGNYSVPNLLPGNYIIKITDTGNVLGGVASTTGGNTQVEDLALSEINITHDFGYFIPASDISIVKTVSSMSPQIGCNVTFTLTASNAGPGNATNTKVTDLLPSGYTFVSATPSAGTYNSVTGVWDVGLLNIGAVPTLQIVATVNPSGVYLNTATIASGDIVDINATNNSSSVTPVPTVAIVATNTTSTAAICENTAKALTATPAGGTWSVLSGGGTILGTTYTPADVAADTPVTIRYTVAAVGSCPATTSDVAFTVNVFAGTATNTTSTAPICENTAKALTATPAGGTWSVLSGGGTILGTTYTPADVTADTPVTIRYTVAAVGSCPATTSDVAFTVNVFAGTATNTTSTAPICENTAKALTATPAGGTWSVLSGGGTILGTTYTPADVAADTPVTIRYTVAANGSCAATTSDVAFTVNVFAGTATNTTSTAPICENTAKALTATPAGGTWSVLSGGGTILGTTYTPADVAADTPVTIRYTVAANGSCAATTSDVAFTVNVFAGTATNTTSTAPICENTAKALTATPAGGTWSVLSGGGTILGTTYTPADVAADTPVTIRYTVAANGSCAATTSDVAFTVNVFAGTATNTTSTAAICENTTKALTATPAGGTWSVLSGGGTILGTTYTPADVAADTPVTIRYTVAANGSCAATTSDVAFTVNIIPTAPTVGTITQPTCLLVTGSVVLNDLPAGDWTINPGNITGNTATTTISGLAAGTTFNYTVTLSGCTSGSVKVVINNYVCPVADSGTIPATGGVVIPNVAANDVVNGLPATLGVGGNATIATSGVWPAGVTLNPTTGAINVAVGTIPGVYPVTYQLCDKLTPQTCATVVNTVTVTAVVTPVTESNTIPATGGVVIPNVAANDVVNGLPATLGVSGNATIATSGVWPVGVTLNPTTGAINVAVGTIPGVYPVTYQLCDKLTPQTCATVVNTVTVTAVVTPVTESNTIPATGGVVIPNVAANDVVNGLPATLGVSGNATIATSGVWPVGVTLNPTTGAINVAVGTIPGVYPVTYQLCDKLTPQTCATVVNTVTVTAVLNPVADSGTAPSTGGEAIPNVALNDVVNGLPATLGVSGNATIATSGVWPVGVTLNPTTGAINVAVGTIPGVYPVTYQLCDKLTPQTCATVVNTVTVTAVLNPVADSGTAPSTGGEAIPNVALNDVVNGLPATLGVSGNATIATSGVWPVGVTLNPTTGAINVAVGTIPGVYPVTYQLCDKLTPQTCATVVNTVTVTAVLNPVADSGTAPSTGGEAIPNVALNDVVNGLPATLGVSGNATIATSGVWPVGVTLNPTTGAINVAVGTIPGVYPVTYQLCDKLTPQTCATVVNTVTVTAVLNPVADSGTAPSTGGEAIPNVALNDVVNGLPATLGVSGNATIATSGVWPVGVTLNPTTGAINVAVGTIPGVYPVTYQLCDKLTPQTCATVVNTVTVTAVLNPVADSGTAPSTGGEAIPNVALNDVVNGLPATLGVSGNATIATSGVWPVGVTLNPTTGAINVAVGTIPGVYPVTYQLCDKLTPQTCATVVNTVTVTAVLNPVADSGTAPSTGGEAIPNVALNDVVNGLPATLGVSGNATIATSGVWPVGVTLNPTTGAINVAVGTIPGVYPVTYQLCDKLTPQTCATVVNTVTVTAVLNPVADSGTAPSTGGEAIPNVALNDVVNGLPATLGVSGNATIATSGVWPVGVTLNPTTGAINVAVGTIPGVYPVTYQLCDKLTPQTCATVVDTVTVTAVLNPVADSGTAPSTGGEAIPNVALNDVVNGLPATLGVSGNATIATSGVWPVGVTLNPTTGAINVAVGTIPGVYPVTYQLCDKLTPQTCATVVNTVTVTAVLNPVADSGTAPSTGGEAIPNVALNDVVNGLPATLGVSGNATIATSGVWPVGVTLNPTTGAINVAVGTIPGVYPVTYQLCDKLTPQTCATVVDTVTVTAVLNPVADSGTAPSTGGEAIPNVALNDVVNGLPATLGVSGNATIATSGVWPVGVTLNPTTGAINVAVGTIPGVYPVTYQLCDKLTPQTCATVVNTVTVTAVLNPVADSGTAPSTGGEAIPNVALNDVVNGLPATLGVSGNATIATSGVWPVGVTLNPTTGAINVAVGTIPGVYPVTYQLCDKLTPQTCATVVNTVTVTAVLNPVADSGTAPSTGGEAIPNVALNDVVNGLPATLGVSGNATIATSGVWPVGVTLNPTTGAINVAVGTIPGVYPVTYQLCDKLTPQTCATVVNTVTVTAVLNPVADSGTAPSTGGEAIPNVALNDVVNGLPATLGVSGNATIATSGVWPVGVTLNPTTGAINVAVGTIPGVYPVTYQLCDKLTPQTCATVVNTVTVTAVLNPVADSGTAPSTGGEAIPNVALNDVVNGLPATLGVSGNATIATSGVWPVGVTLNPTTGAINVAVGTIPGVYPVTYQLCDKLTPQTCATVVNTVTVTAVLNPVADSGTAPSTGGEAIPNVALNDVVNGLPATLGVSGNATIATSGVWPVGVTLNPTTGAINVAVGTIPGVYPVTYQLCDKLTPQTCATVVNTVTVTAVLNPVADSGTAPSTGGEAIPNVALNDVVNGLPATLGVSGNATIATSGVWPVGVTLNPTTGAINVAVGTIPGVYPVTYQLCDKLTPQTCATVVDTVTVTAVVNPVAENGTVPATGGVAILNVAANDVVNGLPATLGVGGNATVATSGVWPVGITLDQATGAINVVAGMPPGNYPVTYQLCDNLTPQKCNMVTVQVAVALSVIIAIDDVNTIPIYNGVGGSSVSVLLNDTLNGGLLTGAASVTIQPVSSLPSGMTMNYTSGVITVGTSVAPGTYVFTYTICENLNLANCSTATVTIEVLPSNVIIYNGVTPNGDGDNDVFYLENIEFMKESSVEIYNRWGVLVYEVSGYDNKEKSFKGISEGRVTLERGSLLPVGTYYYIVRYVDLKNESIEKAGYLHLTR
ncbi:gliding motility-associated C-terminal domain-containing protein [Flavobacterium psychrophilum]|uniref:T9SS type B sorting domain-containing protein n=5 Tax=Flavobacterium psychrophilum TaxID=96345 RepID=UPI003B437EEA